MKVIVTQVRSAIGREHNQRATLKSLGLGKIGRAVEVKITPSIAGMLRTVSHMITVQEAGK